MAGGVDNVGEKRLGGTTTVDVKTFLEAFLNMSMTCACSIDKAFSVKTKYFGLGTTTLNWDYQDFQIIRCQIERILH